MTAVRIIEDHKELENSGRVTHSELDDYVNTSPILVVSGAAGALSPAARKLTIGDGLALVDNGPGSDVVLSALPVVTIDATVSWMERPSGDNDGVNTTFVLSYAPNPQAALMFYVNGLLLEPGIGNDYTLSGSAVSLLYPQRSGSNFRATFPY